MTIARLLAVLLVGIVPAAAFAGSGADLSFGAGATATAGSSGYRQWSTYGDAYWHASQVDPYAWAEGSSDNFINQLTLAGGVWKDLREDLRVKGGGGLITGRVKDVGLNGGALMVEAGVEKDFNRPTVGLGWRFTTGTLVGPGILPQQEQVAVRRGQSSTTVTQTSLANVDYNEFSAYERIPVSSTTVNLSAALGLLSDLGPLVIETVGWRFPVGKSWSLTPAVSFEQQGGVDYVYYSLSLYYLF